MNVKWVNKYQEENHFVLYKYLSTCGESYLLPSFYLLSLLELFLVFIDIVHHYVSFSLILCSSHSPPVSVCVRARVCLNLSSFFPLWFPSQSSFQFISFPSLVQFSKTIWDSYTSFSSLEWADIFFFAIRWMLFAYPVCLICEAYWKYRCHKGPLEISKLIFKEKEQWTTEYGESI